MINKGHTENNHIHVTPKGYWENSEGFDILQRLAAACQDYPEILPDDVRTVLSEWESFSEG